MRTFFDKIFLNINQGKEKSTTIANTRKQDDENYMTSLKFAPFKLGRTWNFFKTSQCALISL